MRLLAGMAAAQPFQTTFTGDASLRRRPMRRVIAPLTAMGARVDSHDGRPPLTVHGARLHGIAHVPEVPSAQIKSCVLLAGLLAEGTTSVEERTPTRDHTERAIETFGGRVGRTAGTVSVDGALSVTRNANGVVPDWPSAADTPAIDSAGSGGPPGPAPAAEFSPGEQPATATEAASTARPRRAFI